MKTKWVSLLVLFVFLAACSPSAPSGSGQVKLTLGAYTTPREAYKELIPMFQKEWKAKTGQNVVFEESYLGSGAQSRAIVNGFEADIAALSLEADITRIQSASLITHDWTTSPNHGIVSTSVVAFAVRPGNPKGIHDWADLAKPGLNVLTPNPATSGGAMWNILALYGAAKRGYVQGVPKDDDTAAQAFLVSVLKNVSVMDAGARESINNFANGVGDVAITYENEVLVGQMSGQKYELVVPSSSILIENPVAVVDTYVDKHGTRQAAEDFVAFLFSDSAQRVFAKYGLRSPIASIATASASQYQPLKDQFDISFFGGWPKATKDFFSDTGIYSSAIRQAQGK